MVQMKRKKYLYVSTHQGLLYIPHGSDETKRDTPRRLQKSSFISHMVQMKPCKKLLEIPHVLNFISHMVQMKQTCEPCRQSVSRLYIPHGSDETHTPKKIQFSDLLLYIPHGSDETNPQF